MKKRFLAWLIVLVVLFSVAGCSSADEAAYQKYRSYFFDTFDTVVSLTAYARDEAEFKHYAALLQTEMTRYHQIFDQYHAYEGVQNLYAVNHGAAKAPVQAEPELMALLLQVRSWRERYGGALNPAMGAVLTLWHDAREDGIALPDAAALADAALHMDESDVILDEAACTVFFTDDRITLDVGAVAKGYAAQLAAQTLRDAGLNSFLINAGGNVVCGDQPLDGRAFWSVGIEDLDGVNTREIIGVVNASVVTSGDYQRFYTVQGERYHHLIDPETLYPAAHMHAVSIIHPDSALGDFLSTYAFLLTYEQSRAIIESIPEAEGMWTLLDGTVEMTEGFQKLVDLAKR